MTCTLNTPGAVALSMTINGGGTLNIVPTGTLTITNNLFNNGGGLIIDSDASNSGSVIVGSYTGAIASYQRYLTGGDWHLISTPLSSGGGTIASFITAHGASMTQSGVKYSLATYDNAFPANGVSTWKNYTTDGSNPAPATAFVEAKGYEILMNGNGKVGFTGLINDGPIGFNLTENVTGWNLIGNPFPSSVFGNASAHATDNFLTQNSASLDPSYVSMYIWNPTNSSYDVVNQGTGSFSLAPGQAFFVKSKTGGASVGFLNNMRTHQSANNFQKAAISAIPTINLTIDNNVGTVRGTDIKYISGTTLGLDPGYDAGQLNAVGAANFNLYTHLVQDNGVKFALQAVPDTNYNTTVIPIGIDANAGTQITFKATATDLPTGKKVFLEDKLLNTVSEINNTDKSYTVNFSTSSSGTGRFFLHTKVNSTLAIDDYLASQYTLVTSPEQQNIRLYGTVAEKGSINIFDSLGRMVYTTKLQKGNEQDINVPIMSTGIYFVKFNIDNKPFSKKILWY
ncbi:T9SS type A sorting domain-containing protein [Polaribacter gochangensis]|uniref:T9SS type A sorting domain-containing protein n=1 Tax=Polaribacter gochangensis TaxID=3252903 RepID=UPI003904CB8F